MDSASALLLGGHRLETVLVQTVSLVGTLFVIGFSRAASQQSSETSVGRSDLRRATIAVGVGNTFGWLGAAGEFYVLDARASAVVGVGFWPDPALGGAAYALAVRGYLGGRRHRIFGEGSWSNLSRSDWYDPGSDVLGVDRHYGPGLSGGYQYTAGTGMTLLVAAGAGWESEYSDIVTILNLGVGYTWRN